MDGYLHLGVRTQVRLTMKQAFGYLSRYKAIDYIDRHYGYVHTQSFASVIDDMAEFCRRKGGEL